MRSVLKITTMKTQLKDRFREMGVFKNNHMQGPPLSNKLMDKLLSGLHAGLVLMVQTNEEGAAVDFGFLYPVTSTKQPT